MVKTIALTFEKIPDTHRDAARLKHEFGGYLKESLMEAYGFQNILKWDMFLDKNKKMLDGKEVHFYFYVR